MSKADVTKATRQMTKKVQGQMKREQDRANASGKSKVTIERVRIDGTSYLMAQLAG